MANNILQTTGLTVYYGEHRGIVDLDLSVQEGEAFGFLGPNGAGKTTTLRVLMDIIRPSRGRATIFGLDCQTEGVAIRQRVGYLPGELSLYPTMTGSQFLDMVGSVRGHEDKAYRRELCERLQLDTSRKLREYSRGNKQKVGLVAAMMHKPDLLILDEPTSGLDPIVQATVLEIVREAKAGGRTVFFSSHILPEVQEVCDRVGIIRDGRLVATESVDVLTHQQFRRLKLTFAALPPPDAFVLEGVSEGGRDGLTVTLEVRQNLNAVLGKAATFGVIDLESPPISLEEAFLAYYGSHEGGAHV